MRASHILVNTVDEAQKIVEKITNGGTTFEELARYYSRCPSSNRGGDLGEFGTGQMVPEFESAVLALEVGQISSPVRTQFGYHFILRTA